MPKQTAADPADAVSAAITAVDNASDASTKASALEPLVILLADPAAVTHVIDQVGSIFAAVMLVLTEAADTAPADASDGTVKMLATTVQLLSALCEHGVSTAAVAGCIEPLMRLVAPELVADAEYNEARVSLIVHACTAITVVASTPEGRLALRKASALQPLLSLCQPELSNMPAVQAQAAVALARLIESPTCRARLSSPTILSMVLALVPTFGTPAAVTDALALRARSKLLLFLGLSLYDGGVLPHLLKVRRAIVEKAPAASG